MNLLVFFFFCVCVVLCEYKDVLWEEDVRAKIGFGKCLHGADTYNADVSLSG